MEKLSPSGSKRGNFIRPKPLNSFVTIPRAWASLLNILSPSSINPIGILKRFSNSRIIRLTTRRIVVGSSSNVVAIVVTTDTPQSLNATMASWIAARLASLKAFQGAARAWSTACIILQTCCPNCATLFVASMMLTEIAAIHARPAVVESPIASVVFWNW